MKILILSSLFPPHIFGGAEIVAANLAALLASRGHEVSVATLQEADTADDWGTMTAEGYRIYRLPKLREYTLYERHDEHLSKTQKMRWHGQDYFDPRNRKAIKRLMDAVQPDHVDVHNVMGIGYNALSVLNDYDSSVSITLHDVALACFQTTLTKNGIPCEGQCKPCKVSSFLRQKSVFSLNNLRFISPSQANIDNQAPYVPALSKHPIAVIRNAPDTLPALPDYTESPTLRLLFAGRLDEVKGIRFLCEVLDELSRELASFPVTLSIMGKGPLEAELTDKYHAKPWFDF